MATPTITSITPTTGPAGGRTVVKITGGNFAVPPTPARGETWAQTIQVLFGTEASQRVLPYGADLIVCVSPPWRGTPRDTAQVDVTVNNLDPATGLPVSGESATQVNGWTYMRGGVDDEKALAWITDHLAMHMSRQIIDDVIPIATHPDWDPNQATAKIEIESIPAIVLTPRQEFFDRLPAPHVESGVATAASVTDTTTYPVTAGTGALKLKLDREDTSQVVTFAGTETTAAQVAATIAAQITGGTAEESGGQVEITSATTGALSFVEVTQNPSANPLLTFPTAEQQGQPEETTRQVGKTAIDVVFDVRGVEHGAEKIENLADMFRDFVDRSAQVPIPQTIGDADSDPVWVPIMMVDEPSFPFVPEGNSLVKEFLATIVLKNLELGESGIAALSEDFHTYVGVADIELDIERLADT